MTAKKKNQPNKQSTKLPAKLQTEVARARESEKRAIADYKNLERRNENERAQFIQFATRELVSSLLGPIDHLNLAATKINDQGLDMVVEEFDQVLQISGLTPFNPEGESFDLETMEAIEKQGKGEKVIKVVKKGYKLDGKVIQHAQVVVG